MIGTVSELKAKTQKSDATLEDVFIYFTGTALQEEGDLRDIQRARRTIRKLG